MNVLQIKNHEKSLIIFDKLYLTIKGDIELYTEKMS